MDILKRIELVLKEYASSINFIIILLTLIISVVTVYYSFYHSVDKLLLKTQKWDIETVPSYRQELKLTIKANLIYTNSGTDNLTITDVQLFIIPIKNRLTPKENKYLSLCHVSKLSNSRFSASVNNSLTIIEKGNVKVIETNQELQRFKPTSIRYGVCLRTQFMTNSGKSYWAGSPGTKFYLDDSKRNIAVIMGLETMNLELFRQSELLKNEKHKDKVLLKYNNT